MTALADKLLVTLRRDLLSALRYRRASWAYSLGMLAELAAFFYLARAIGPQFRPDGVDYFPFLLVGTGFYTFFVAGIASFINSVHDAQVTGTMEVLMTTATPEPVIVGLGAFSAFAAKAGHMLLYLAAGLVIFGVPLHQPNVLGAVLVFVLSLMVAVAAGIAAAALQVALQKGSGVVWLISSFAWLLTGTTFPVSALPAPLQYVARLVPITHSLDGLRLALLRGAGWAELSTPLAVLALWAALLLPLSLFLFSRALRYARLEGTLSFY